jgi:hypothetical protein
LPSVTTGSELFPTLGTNHPEFAIAGTMGSRDT